MLPKTAVATHRGEEALDHPPQRLNSEADLSGPPHDLYFDDRGRGRSVARGAGIVKGLGNEENVRRSRRNTGPTPSRC